MTHTKEWHENWKPPEIKHGIPTRWNWTVLYPDKLRLGRWVDIGAYTLIQAEAGVWIGDKVEIGSHCAIFSVDTIDDRRGQVTIEDLARVGSHVIILPDVTIGRNSIVGAGTFLSKNVPPDVVVHPERGLTFKPRKRI